MSATTMADRVEEYLAYRRALGYQIRIEGQLLRSFARYADDVGPPRAADDRDSPSAGLGLPEQASPAVSGPAAGGGAGAGRLPGPTRARHRGPAPRPARPGSRPEAGLHLLAKPTSPR